ncbi:hypothetical protein [Sinobaca sp. H24]|uniref:hypothetical protein n=1 Tax=Sinobaca sp. H24 TaxID=2923376 RepID=UPI00207A3694|nr:hypothetical protein [Sinobaca sp. H24]
MEDRLKFAVIYAALVFVIAVPFTFVVKESDVSWGLSSGRAGSPFCIGILHIRKKQRPLVPPAITKKPRGVPALK